VSSFIKFANGMRFEEFWTR